MKFLGIKPSMIFALIGGLFSFLAWIFELIASSHEYKESEERLRKIAREEARKSG